MKRLLVYLFIVLGLGLTFSVSANAKGFYPKYHSKHPEKIFISKCRGTGEKCPINTKTHKNIYKYVKKNLNVALVYYSKLQNNDLINVKDDIDRIKEALNY